MKIKKAILYLIAADLIAIFLYIIGKFRVVNEFVDVFVFVIFTPIIFGVFLFYILKPLNEIFIKKGLKHSLATTLTLIIFVFILSGIINYFGQYFIKQTMQLRRIINSIFIENNIKDFTSNSILNNQLKSFTEGFSNQITRYINLILANISNIFNRGMMLFSNVILVFLITFFLLRDGHKFKPKVLKYCPEKYKNIVGNILSQGDTVLSSYIIGQATVALSLATMVFIGYKIIGMPGALFLATTTFILAFIPFVGFFISMIIPYIIATSVGFIMIVKLSILFIIAQTLKGRVVVPFIMGRAMKIHPITDIFLVVGAATIGGPIGAFCIVPIYALLKVALRNLKDNGYISYEKIINKKFDMKL